MRILQTMLHVGDVQRSINFYTRVMGMQPLGTTDRPEQKYSLALVGYGDEQSGAVIELTYHYGVPSYDIRGAFGHITNAVDDAATSCVSYSRSRCTRHQTFSASNDCPDSSAVRSHRGFMPRPVQVFPSASLYFAGSFLPAALCALRAGFPRTFPGKPSSED